MTIWIPDTCHCIANVEKEILIERCKTHVRYAETIIHNRSFGNPDRGDQVKRLEKAKPEFQRR